MTAIQNQFEISRAADLTMSEMTIADVIIDVRAQMNLTVPMS
jgi:hypothetical protein